MASLIHKMFLCTKIEIATRLSLKRSPRGCCSCCLSHEWTLCLDLDVVVAPKDEIGVADYHLLVAHGAGL